MGELGRGPKRKDAPYTSLHQPRDRTMDDRPVIVCGLGRVGKRVLDYVRAAALPAVVVEQKLDPATLPPGVRGVVGDCRQADILERAGVRDARGGLVCTRDDLVNLA